MNQLSDYFSTLSSEAKERYEAKIVCTGLKIDSYVIEDWNEAPEEVPDVRWSDIMLDMVSNPNPYTREEIKVARRKIQACTVNFRCLINKTLVSKGIVKAGWILSLRLHQFVSSD